MTEEGGAVRVDVPLPEEGKSVVVAAFGTSVLVCNVGGELLAVENRCTHARVELTVGRIIGSEIECPVHGARFDLHSGTATCRPARRPLRTFKVERVDAGMTIRLD